MNRTSHGLAAKPQLCHGDECDGAGRKPEIMNGPAKSNGWQYALREPIHWIGWAVIGLAALVMRSHFPWIIGLAAEAIYLGLFASSPYYRRVLQARRQKQIEKQRRDQRLNVLAGLPRDLRDRYWELHRTVNDIMTLWQESSLAATFPEETGSLPTESLLDRFLDVAELVHRLDRALERTSRPGLRSVDTTGQAVDRDVQELQVRRDALTAELDRIEDTVRQLHQRLLKEEQLPPLEVITAEIDARLSAAEEVMRTAQAVTNRTQ